MKYNNNVHLLGKNINLVQEKLDLNKMDLKNEINNKNNEKIGNKIENDWNIVSYEITKDIEIKEIFMKINDSLSEIIDNSSYSDDIFSFTIIYSLEEFINEKENIINFLNIILEKLESNFYLPFFIFLVRDENDKSEFEKLLEENKKIDKRNISCFISPLNENINDKDKEIIKLKIMKIFS